MKQLSLLLALLLIEKGNSFFVHVKNIRKDKILQRNILRNEHNQISSLWNVNKNIYRANTKIGILQEQILSNRDNRRMGYNYYGDYNKQSNVKLYSTAKEESSNTTAISPNKSINPLLQILIVLLTYLFHLTILTQHSLAFPIQLIPNNKGYFQSIGYDTLAGITSILFYITYSSKHPTQSSPWKIPKTKISNSARAFTYLLLAYGMTGKFSIFFEDLFYVIGGMGIIPLTIATHRSLVVLFGHLLWVGIGSLILHLELKTFFSNKKKTKWYTCQIRNTNWLWWVIGGYFASCFVFNMSDFINQLVIPKHYFQSASEGVVSQLIQPENNDRIASFIGYIAPCISAPWWEEVLYRGFMLPAINMILPLYPSILSSSLIFSAHHLSVTGFIPLTMLGITWAFLYSKCRNLFVTVFIHALWNSRVFLGSWFGL